jgi:hypothetical protein
MGVTSSESILAYQWHYFPAPGQLVRSLNPGYSGARRLAGHGWPTVIQWFAYRLVADESLVKPASFANVFRLQEAVQTILRSYADEFYKVQRQRWESENMEYKLLDNRDDNFQHYKVRISRQEKQLIEAVHKLMADADQIYQADTRDLPDIHFDRHLYQPLLVAKNEKIRSDPPGLVDSERRFVEDLRTYCRAEKDKSLANREIYLLRNLSRGKGIGFFSQRGFYPDFILWIKQGEWQRIIFIEPHGMLMAKAYLHDDKARLHEALPKHEQEIADRSEIKNVRLDSFIISATPFEELRLFYEDGTWDMKRFAEKHILFPLRNIRYDYISTIMSQQPN